LERETANKEGCGGRTPAPLPAVPICRPPAIVAAMAETNPPNPWKTLSSALQYENAWIRVTEHQVLNPSAKPGIYGTVHFKHLATGVVALDDELHTWLVGQWRYSLDRYSWEIPEGGGPLDVDPLVTAKRELLEETGIEAADWKKVLEVHLSNSVTDEIGHIYLARGLSFTDSRPEETEDIAVRRLPFAEAYAMALDGRITDVMSVAAILRVRLLLDQPGP
jgi:ADP-ribose pyrophosphatase